MKTIYLIPLLLLSACASNRTPTVLHMSHSVPGMALPSEGIDTVRYSENIKAYNVGRYVDPNNALAMHEQHRRLPRETDRQMEFASQRARPQSRWGPVVRIIDPAERTGR